MSGAQPQPQAQPKAQPPSPPSQPQPEQQPHRPPQAYPAPPSESGSGARSGTRKSGSGGSGAEGSGGSGGDGNGGDAGQGAVRKPRTGASTIPRTRKARLRVAKADPWSVMKVSFLLAVALGVCTVVAVAVLWMVMNAMGVFSTLGGTVSEATSAEGSGGFDLESFLSLPRVLLFTSLIAVINVVLATALATLASFIYNLSAGFVGGVELTLAEDE
ncbi:MULTISPECIES: DUF3566 domain-containing protein [unclassified Streptomyces]|uniref:DUF3566 domain-containing protein n=1 Tax=unclassified Streptomyces TaxID=2593676 RepID=UPI002DD7DCBC|nr:MULTISPECIES: DUF3566 domain-containing protein [unclassified Streptomyces]WSA93625.1 DUF3566 domain-containing protein [Streptomyces sp. NBC_01795]WSB77997.1 DUF3566 domain-containing protein [Streptomyces sp. NBC_01775]WSS13750.1 DUF3566 domain-containing protein [Streptomyces sp. NBC_01186]WSS42573.1 DUF3566 domain-containing protein [Streptomyces sp. NBC_01187]